MPFLGFRRHVSQRIPMSRRIVVAHNPPPNEIYVPERYPSNKVVTSKYTAWNFLPKNFFEQFRRIANFYFLCIAVVQLSINSPVSPATSLTPLIFVVSVTAIKQAYEDWMRHRADNVVNTMPVWVYSQGKLVAIRSQDIKVGDVVMIQTDEEVPCDLVLLSTSDPDGKCHITTANLDGETNLKVHECSPATRQYQTSESFCDLKAVIECEHPTPDLYRFAGKMTVYESETETVNSLGPINLLLKGARLKNTAYVYGCAIYTGQDTKMTLNLRLTSNKFSTVEKSMNKFLVVFLLILLTEATTGTILMILNNDKRALSDAWYLPSEIRPQVAAVTEDFLSFAVLFNYIIPISLYVTLEMVKFIGSKFFVWDMELYDGAAKEAAQCNSSDLNEELGQIEYLFTDKTGTLTENEMHFRQCTVGGVNYEERNGQLCFNNVPMRSYPIELEHFLLVLTLCNTVQINKHSSATGESCGPESGIIEYQASSPDEKALVEACARFGIVLWDISDSLCTISTRDGLKIFKKLCTLEFDSHRKRMSVIVQDETGSIYLLCKGADSAVLDRDHVSGKHVCEDLKKQIKDYATRGLRVLVVAEKKMSEEEFRKFSEELKEAYNELGHREEALGHLFDTVEQNLCILGATAVEDRLQEGVKLTLDSLRTAGIKIWMLTGDSLETAVNVSNSCGHFKEDMMKLYLTRSPSPDECYYTLRRMLYRIDEEPLYHYALIIDGYSLTFALQNCSEVLAAVGERCTAVLCCRMSPLQKAEVVKLMKHSSTHPITAAIGDGANDVSMIQEAHVGLGIMGKEGRQAVRCSDFAISKFHFLRRVILVHGQYYYIRVSTLVQYFFYKNIAFIIPQFIYIFFNGFTPQPVYNSIFLMMYNIFFTSLPIFIYGLTEKHACEEFLMNNPECYRKLTRNSHLTIYQFSKWFLQGLWHSFVFFFGLYFLWGDSLILSTGKTLGIWAFGAAMFHVVVIAVNLKLCLHTKYWTGLFIFSLVASIVGFISFTLLYSSVYWSLKTSLLYGVYLKVLSSGSIWFGTFILTAIALFPDIMVFLVERHAEAFKQMILSVEGIVLVKALSAVIVGAEYLSASKYSAPTITVGAEYLAKQLRNIISNKNESVFCQRSAHYDATLIFSEDLCSFQVMVSYCQCFRFFSFSRNELPIITLSQLNIIDSSTSTISETASHPAGSSNSR